MHKQIKWRNEPSGSLTVIWPYGTSHAGEEWTFSRPGGGYVYCDFGKSAWTGTLGKQICHGGGLMGTTILARDDDYFTRVVKKWLADYRCVST